MHHNNVYNIHRIAYDHIFLFFHSVQSSWSATHYGLYNLAASPSTAECPGTNSSRLAATSTTTQCACVLDMCAMQCTSLIFLFYIIIIIIIVDGLQFFLKACISIHTYIRTYCTMSIASWFVYCVVCNKWILTFAVLFLSFNARAYWLFIMHLPSHVVVLCISSASNIFFFFFLFLVACEIRKNYFPKRKHRTKFYTNRCPPNQNSFWAWELMNELGYITHACMQIHRNIFVCKALTELECFVSGLSKSKLSPTDHLRLMRGLFLSPRPIHYPKSFTDMQRNPPFLSCWIFLTSLSDHIVRLCYTFQQVYVSRTDLG